MEATLFPVTVDTIVQELGFGKFQAISFGFIALAMFINSIVTSVFIFTARDTQYRCRISECDKVQAEYDESWLPNAVPFRLNQPSKCLRYGPKLPPYSIYDSLNDTCRSQIFDRSSLEKCDTDGWVYGEGNTIVKEFDIACQDWKRALVGTMNGMGQLVCLIYVGFLSDRYGRRNMMVYATFASGVIGTAQSFSWNYWSFVFFEFLNTAVTTGAYSAAFILGMESLAPERRVAGSTFINFATGFSSIFLGFAAWIFPYWRTLLRVTYVPSIFIIFCLWIIPESIRWSITKGRNIEAVKIINEAAKQNKKTLSESTKNHLQLLISSTNVVEDTSLRKKDKVVGDLNFTDVLRSRRLTIRLIVCALCWVTNAFVYYGLSINVVSLSTDKVNIYLNFILLAIVDLPAQFIYLYLLDRAGRRKSLCGSLLSCGAACVAFSAVPQDWSTVSLVLYMFAKLCISLSFSIIYIYTAEMFPTSLRHSCVGSCSMLGRIGTVIAPLTVLLIKHNRALPLILYATAAIMSGLSILIFPETLNTQLPDSIEEAENIGTEVKHNTGKNEEHCTQA